MRPAAGARLLILLALCPAGHHGMATPSEEREAAGAGAADEPLLWTSPAGAAMAARAVDDAFERGVRDIDRYVQLSKLVLQHTLALAGCEPGEAFDCAALPQRASDGADEAAAYLRAAVPMAYNLAANTWPGWGEGVGAIEGRHRRLGLEAARLNVALAAAAGLGPERRRNGYWILGAHLIAAGDLGAAADAFAASRDLAAEAGLDQAALMASGWIHVCGILAGRDETAALTAVGERLRGDRHGDLYADQYDAALEVFGGR